MDLSSRPSLSRISSRRDSVSSEFGYKSNQIGQYGTSTYSSNVGLAKILNERPVPTHELSQSNLDKFTKQANNKYQDYTTSNRNNGTRDSSPFIPNEVASSIMSLTPSVISSPTGSKTVSPTGTPLNSPLCSPPGTPPNERSNSKGLEKSMSSSELSSANRPEGLVYGFFASLKNALYGEQQKEAKSLIRKRSKKDKKRRFKRLGILEKVEEVGVENLLSNHPSGNDSPFSGSSSNYYISGSQTHRNLSYYASDSNDGDDASWKDELEDIEPGSLTICAGERKEPLPISDHTVGQLSAPSFSVNGRPSLNPNELGHVPSTTGGDIYSNSNRYDALGGGTAIGGRGPGRVISPGEKRPTLSGRLGVPGHPGTGALSGSLVRPDLGYVPTTSAKPLHVGSGVGSAVVTDYPFQSGEEEGGFIGSITSMFFGRKGGLF